MSDTVKVTETLTEGNNQRNAEMCAVTSQLSVIQQALTVLISRMASSSSGGGGGGVNDTANNSNSKGEDSTYPRNTRKRNAEEPNGNCNLGNTYMSKQTLVVKQRNMFYEVQGGWYKAN